LFFAVLIASVGAFAYDRRLSSQLAQQVEAFRAATLSFDADEERLQRVLSIDRRLVQVNDRLQNSASMSALLTALEATTLQSAQVESFNMTRENDDSIMLELSVLTDTFDSVLFQRSVLEDNDVLKTFELSDVTVVNGDLESATVSNAALAVSAITFRATFEIEPETISVVPTRQQLLLPVAPSVPEVATPVVTDETPVTPEVQLGIVGNQENI
jgi:hypothetical protein